MADEEGMTQRERRAERSRSRPAGNAPKAPGGVRWKTMKPLLIIGLILAAVIGAIVLFNYLKPTCPDHWHATQAVFVPSGTKDAAGFDTGRRIDWSAPTTASGQHYYDFGRNAEMTLTMHMHQSGDEQGSDALGPAQFHYEGGKCMGIQRSYEVIDLDVSGGHLEVEPNTPLSSVPANQGGPWNDDGQQKLRFFLQSRGADGQWTWAEKSIADHLHYQLKDGEAMLLAFGHYSDEAIKGFQAQVPPPISRSYMPVEPSPTTTSATTTSMSMSNATTAPATTNGTTTA